MVTKPAVPSAKPQQATARLGDGERSTEHAAGGGGAERHDRRRPHDRALDLEPDLAAIDLVDVGALVQPPLAAHLVLEMLDRVGDENVGSVNSGFRERPVEHVPGRTDKRLAGQIFFVPGLLAHQHEMGVAPAFTRYRLGGMAIKRTTRALILCLGELAQGGDGGRRFGGERKPVLHGGARQQFVCQCG